MTYYSAREDNWIVVCHRLKGNGATWWSRCTRLTAIVDLQAETDERVSKAIDRYMFRAFRDDESDSNPLLRKNNLSVSNPLL